MKISCEVCGKVIAPWESCSVNYAGSYTHVCKACYEGESGLTLCKGCGLDADYCLVDADELVPYQEADGDTGYACQAMIAAGYFRHCVVCGDVWSSLSLEDGVCPECQAIRLKTAQEDYFYERY